MAKKKSQPAPKDNSDLPIVIDEQAITHTITTNFMPYAMSVIVSRAIPEIDGLKPSHRKLLYTMYKMNLLNGNLTKSANVVGQTMKLNPHGDAAIYETMVRLSRGNGALLHPFVESKGNFGKVFSRDMSYAASRYTEVKLDGICHELFDEIDLDAVDFVPNYDNSMQEPTLLPTRFPNVLVNPNQGIAVGMASNICSFNLEEVCRTAIELIRNPKHDVTETLLAPDFPTGGELIYDRRAISEVYNTGRGTLKVRGRWRYDKKENLIEIYEIPYTTTVEAIMDKTTELLKAGQLREIADMRDETDRSGLKLAIDLKRGADPDALMQKMFRVTSLEDSFGCNFNILIAGTPRVMGVAEILTEWTAWRLECVKRRIFFDLTKKSERLHLLQGLKKILLNIDKAIAIIRGTAEERDVVPNLMTGFDIDQIQAEYIADIRLRNINREYILKRVEETSALEEEIDRLNDLLRSRTKLNNLIIKELTDIIKKYGAPRRTGIIQEEDIPEVPETSDVPDYPVHLFMTRDGYFKKVTPQSLRMSGDHKLKESDELRFTLEGTNREEVVFLTNLGQAYKSRLSDFEDTKISTLGDYLPAKLKMDEGERPVFVFLPGDYTGKLIYVFDNGKVAKIGTAGFATKTNRRRLSGAMSTKAGLVAAFHIREDVELALCSNAGRMLLFSTAAVAEKAAKDTQGVNVMTLKPKHQIDGAYPAQQVQMGDPKRYRTKTIPAAGAIIRPEDGPKPQESLQL